MYTDTKIAPENQELSGEFGQTCSSCFCECFCSAEVGLSLYSRLASGNFWRTTWSQRSFLKTFGKSREGDSTISGSRAWQFFFAETKTCCLYLFVCDSWNPLTLDLRESSTKRQILSAYYCASNQKFWSLENNQKSLIFLFVSISSLLLSLWHMRWSFAVISNSLRYPREWSSWDFWPTTEGDSRALP